MNQRRHLSIVAAAATLMAAAPLKVLYTPWTWAIDAFIAVATVCATAIAARALRAPSWLQPIATTLALLLVVTWLFPSGNEFGRLIPSSGTFTNFRTLVSAASADMQNLGIPVEFDRKGLLFLTTAGIGLVAVLVDFVAVTLRKPAVAGLPMLAVYAVPVAIDSGTIPFIYYVIGALGYMWLLATDNVDRVRMFGRRFTGDGRGVDMWEPSPLAAIGRRTAVIGVLIAVILPVAVPGLSRGLIGPIGPSIASNHNGFGNCMGCRGTQVNLFADLSGYINDDKERLLVTVTTKADNPPYLRFAVADQISNRGFATGPSQGLAASLGMPNEPYTDRTGQMMPPVYPQYHADVVMGELESRYLPVFLAPVSGTLRVDNDSWRYDPEQQVIFSNSSSARNLRYSFDFEQIDYPVAQLEAAPPLPPTDPIQVIDTKLPSDVKLVDQIVSQAKKGADNQYEVVRNLVDYFLPSNGFAYSLSTEDGTAGSDIANFLTNKKGYCVQYAAALAWLARKAHYPARVAFGFTNGLQKQPGVYQMTSRNLHAWTEIYFSGMGWVPFDATPAIGLTGPVHTSWDPNDAAPSASSGPNSSPGVVLPSGQGGGSASAHRKLPIDPTGGAGAGLPSGNSTNWGLWMLVALGIIVALVLTPALARVLTRNRRAVADRRISADSAAPGEPFVVVDSDSTSSTTKHRVHAAWDEFIDTLVDYRVRIDPTESPRAAVNRLTDALDLPPDAVEGAQMLGMAEERARYARQPGPSQPLHDAVRTIRRALSRRVSFRTRFRADFMPPSVTARWHANLIGWFNNVVATISGVRDAVVRTLNVRRLLRRRAAN